MSRGLNSLVLLRPWGGHATNLLSKGGIEICSSTGGLTSGPQSWGPRSLGPGSEFLSDAPFSNLVSERWHCQRTAHARVGGVVP